MRFTTPVRRNSSPADALFATISNIFAKSAVLPLALIVVFNLAFESAVFRGYFQEDDWHNIKARSAREVLRTFTGEFSSGLHAAGGFYRPFVRVVFALDRALYGLHAWGYHLTNLLLHMLAAALLFWLLRKLTAKAGLALLAALLFSLYPLNPEAVFWLSGRADVMAAAFVLLTLVLFVHFLDSKRLSLCILSALSFAAGLLCKETAIILPVLVALVVVLYRRGEEKRSLRHLALLELPFIIVAAIYLAARTWALGGVGGYQTPYVAIGIARFVEVYDSFISLMVNPFGAIWAGAAGAPGLITFSLIAFIVLVIFNFPPTLLFGLGWMYLAPLTMLSVPPSALEGGRFLYLPVIGYSIFLAGVVAELYEWAKKLFLEKAIVVLGFGLILIYGAFLQEQNGQWLAASQTVRRLTQQIVRYVRHFGLEKTYVLPNLPAKRGSAFIFRGESIVSALPVLLAGSSVAAHQSFRPEDGEKSVVLVVEASNRVAPFRVVEKETAVWENEQLLQWSAGTGMTPLRLEDFLVESAPVTCAVTEITQPVFSGIESPALRISDRWVTFEIRQLITNGGYGVVMWRGGGEPYSQQRMGTLFNDFRNRFLNHPVSMGYVRDLGRVLVRPTNDISRVVIRRIALYTFRLAPYGSRNPRQP
jgi:hypothetical protein